MLEALRNGRFFTTTGEILLTDFAVSRAADHSLGIRAQLQWTFPLDYAEVIGGDGAKMLRHRIDLSHTKEMGKLALTAQLPAEFASCRWLRLEVWDVATNGAFTQSTRLLENGGASEVNNEARIATP